VVLGLTTHNILLAALGGLGMFWIPILWVRRKRTQRLEALRGQLPDALELMGRVLRAGQTMTQAMLAVSKEFRAPVATEFALCYEQQNLGLSADVTLHELSKRTGLIELKIFVLALLVHRRAGGNLAELLEKLSGTIRERYKIRGRVKALTAEGRLQGIVLLAMPPLIFGMLHVVNRPYAMKLYDHPGLIGVSIVSMALGALLIRKIVNFDF
jgi:tight adherence protein B